MKEKEKNLIADIESSCGYDKYKAYIKYSKYLCQSNPEKSFDMAEKARLLAAETHDEKCETTAMISQAYARFYASQFESANHLITKIIQKGMKLDQPNFLGTAYNIKARIAFMSENPGKALELNLKALEYYLKEPDGANLMSCYNNLGMCHLHLKNTEESLNYYQMALDEAEKLGHPAREVILMNIGNIHYEKEDYKTALKKYQRAEKLFEKYDMSANLANVFYNLAITYDKLEMQEKELEYLKKAMDLYEKFNDHKNFSYTSNTIALHYLEKEEFEKVRQYLDISMKVARDHDLKWNIKLNLQAYARYWDRLKNYLEMSKCLQEVIDISEELNREMNHEKLAEMEARYKTKIYKLQKQELNAKNKAMGEQINKLDQALQEQRNLYRKLEKQFEKNVNKLNNRDDLLSTETRMASMGEMISMIAHQWKQPLNVIGVLVQSFLDAYEFDELNEEYITRQVEIVMNQISYMADTINNFRDFFRPEGEILFDFSETIEKALQIVEYSLTRSGITLEKDIESSCMILGVPNDLVQVIINILINASDAMQNKKLTEPVIRMKTLCNDHTITLSIFNKGSRLPENAGDKIFEPYYTTKDDKGTGIGLYICRMIIENKYKGSLTAKNLDDGVEFIIELKAGKGEPDK